MTHHEFASEKLADAEKLSKSHSWLISYAILIAAGEISKAIREAARPPVYLLGAAPLDAESLSTPTKE